jgi:hypothetical protein
MTKEFPMTNSKEFLRAGGFVLLFGLRDYLVIRFSSLVIRLAVSLKTSRNLTYGH